MRALRRLHACLSLNVDLHIAMSDTPHMHRTIMALLAGMTACGWTPTISVPQAEQAVQATEGGGERLRVQRRCVAASTNVDSLVTCMAADGYQFVPRAPGFPGDECWALRDQPREDTPPPAHCFERVSDTSRP